MVRSEVNYWKVDNPAVFSPDNFPVFIGYGEGGPHFYGLPIEEYPGLLKVAFCLWFILITVQLLIVLYTDFHSHYHCYHQCLFPSLLPFVSPCMIVETLNAQLEYVNLTVDALTDYMAL